MQGLKNIKNFVSFIFVFFISIVVTFYFAKYLIPQFIVTAYIVGFLAVQWSKKSSILKGRIVVVSMLISFPLYVLPVWAVADNLSLSILLGTLWDFSTGLGLHAVLTKNHMTANPTGKEKNTGVK